MMPQMPPPMMGPMNGLHNAMGADEMDMAGMGGASPATSLVDAALALHEGHMNGSVPTSPESQQQLMDLLLQIRQTLAE